MLANLWSAFQTLRMLLDFFIQVKAWVKESEKAKADQKAEYLRKALEDLKNAKTKEEFIDAQKRVAANMP